MDDEIDIEEHDILEHPQVKAAFPDLSKIQIQAHATGESFLDEIPATVNLFEDLQEVKDDYQEEIPEDLSESHLNEDNEAIIDEFEEREEFDEDSSNTRDEALVNEAFDISDGENDDFPQANIYDEDNLKILENDGEQETVLNFTDNTFTAKQTNEDGGNLLNNTLKNNEMSKVVTNIHKESGDESQSQLEDGDEDNAENSDDKAVNEELLREDANIHDEILDDEPNDDEFFENAPEYNEEKDISEDENYLDYPPIRIKEEIEFEPESSIDFDEATESYNNDELPPEDIYHFNNKIILGSKPSPKPVSRDNSVLVVMLEDWDVHLRHSQSYCVDCKTLFTTPNALDSHRMAAHSLLAPITNRAMKSTTKSAMNVARKSTGKGVTADIDITKSTYCNHCKITFKDHTTLIKHLYKLLPAKSHQCNICELTFQNQTDLMNHNSVHIKVEPRKILKAKKGADPILRKMLSNGMKPMNTEHISKAIKREHDRDKQEAKLFKQSPVVIKKETKFWTSRFKCLVCNEILENYAIARRHRHLHPEVRVLEKLFKKLPPKANNSKDKLIYENDTNETKSKELKPFDLVPKSALFQCSKCSLHFTSCVAASSHLAGNGCGDKTTWTCPTCKRKFRKKEQTTHKLQHELRTKLKIYKITRNTYERTLCKCLKCGVHFEYISLKAHITKCGKIPTAKCQRCNILLSKFKLVEHIKKHDIMKLKRKDFIFVDYAVVNDNTKAKNNGKNLSLVGKTIKREPVEIGPRVLNKLQYENDKVRVFYCKQCCSFCARRAKSHIAKECVGRYKYTRNCSLCGLQFFHKHRRHHEKLHADNNFTLKDIEFIDIENLKPIIPPIPKYPACKKCRIHFLHRKLIRDHICGEDYENCGVCGEKFENSALAVHLPFHELGDKPKLHELGPGSPPGPRRPKITELMMKYESLNAIWNILFVCGKCELVTDLYNKAVEHSQTHLKKENIQVNTIKCYICNLKFDESCWPKHSDLHSRMSINNKDFKILKYAPQNLLDESWFQMFESLPEQEIRQIIDRSVFGNERSLKMKLVKDGLPEFTLHCCSHCRVCYDNNDILNHVKGNCKSSKHVCGKCDVAFDSAKTLQFHELLHIKGIKKEEFRIVHFVKVIDEKCTNAKVKKVKSAVAQPVLKAKKADDAKYVLYKCAVCSGCVLMKSSQVYHICAQDHQLAYCKTCKQKFSCKQIGTHKIKHKNQPDFRAKNIKVINFEPVPEGEDKPRKHKMKPHDSKTTSASKRPRAPTTETEDSSQESTSYNTRRKPVTSSSVSNNKPSRKADSSKPVSRNESIESEDALKKTAKLYKCDCGLHYTSLKTIQNHIGNCDGNRSISSEACSKCDLLFPTDILVSHLCKHHSKNIKLTVEKVHKTSPKPEQTIRLYKCSDCNVYFLNQNSCYKHISKHEALDPKQYIECKMCCLQFRILSLHIHMKKHHDSEFNLEKVLVEEYHPSVGKQTPKIDIYFANERIQNVQVSSSND